MERDILAKATAWFASKSGDTHIVFELVMANQAVYPVRTLYRVLGVSASLFPVVGCTYKKPIYEISALLESPGCGLAVWWRDCTPMLLKILNSSSSR